jgi:predicted phage tail protein
MSIDITPLKELIDTEKTVNKSIEKAAETRVQELNKFFNDRKKYYKEAAKQSADSADMTKKLMEDCVRKIKDLEMSINTNKRNMEYYLYNQALSTQRMNAVEDLMSKLKDVL